MTQLTAARTGLRLRPRTLLLVLAGNMLVDALEVSAMIVVMPSLGRDLDLSPSSLQWMMSGFALGFGGLLLVGPRVVGRFGRRRVYLAALVVFALASLVAALASGPAVLTLTRLVKGVCAALTAPTGLAIIGSSYPQGPERDRAVSVYTFCGACGFLVGLVSTGLLTEVSWRLALAFPAPVVLVLAELGRRVIPRDGDIWRTPTSPRPGRRRFPDPRLVRAALGAAVLNGSYLGLLFLLTFQLQNGLRWGPGHTALALLPAGAPLALSALTSGRMVRRFGPPRLIALGAAVLPFASLLYLRPVLPHSYATDVLPTLLLLAVSFVLAFAALNVQATRGLPAGSSSIYQATVQAGAVVSVIVAGVLVTADETRTLVALIAAAGGVGLIVALIGLRPNPGRNQIPS
ncbi:MFS transporter [Kineosporia sp. NBRC 101731]|uniref:MFS transporter n=1 Tax=Kineosporia sp. NBRC 101731 TaxID=3032199 RepID=UPI0024A5252B|nr:MFS transporter [Kineosporia sp. NBRC 101731]GLY32458.1 hypothetical protein Kisp02_58230 [Kineosporia sp. NBRC 101731]